MRLLITTDVIGGVLDHAVTLASGVVAAGHHPLLAVIGDPPTGRLSALDPSVPVERRDLRLEWMEDADDDVAAGMRWIARLAERWNPDLVHLNQFAYAAHPFPAPVLVAGHSDVLSWWSEAAGREPPPETSRYAEYVRSGLRGADAVVAPSRYQSRLLEHHYGQGADVVIHNGIEDPQDGRAATEEAPRSGVALAGRLWDRAKGADLLDAALGRLREDAPEAHLLGAREGPGGQRFAARHARCTGWVPPAELRRVLRRSAVYAGASRYEPFGLAPVEAARCGCALLLADIGSFRELWDGAAAFFPSGDADGLAEALRRLTDDGGERERLAAAAAERAAKRYTATRMIEDYLDLYRRVTTRSALRPDRQRLQRL